MEPEPEEAEPAHTPPDPEAEHASIPAPPDPEPNIEPNVQSSASSTTSRPISGVVPPYWRHNRNISQASQSSLRGITLEDHTADPDSETSRGLWARSVSIEDHVVVHGMTGVGSYVVWNCRIQTLDVSAYAVECFGSHAY